MVKIKGREREKYSRKKRIVVWYTGSKITGHGSYVRTIVLMFSNRNTRK
jgi:hypothetical protein